MSDMSPLQQAILKQANIEQVKEYIPHAKRYRKAWDAQAGNAQVLVDVLALAANDGKILRKEARDFYDWTHDHWWRDLSRRARERINELFPAIAQGHRSGDFMFYSLNSVVSNCVFIRSLRVTSAAFLDGASLPRAERMIRLLDDFETAVSASVRLYGFAAGVESAREQVRKMEARASALEWFNIFIDAQCRVLLAGITDMASGQFDGIRRLYMQAFPSGRMDA